MRRLANMTYSPEKDTNPVSQATSSLMEMRLAVSRMGLSEAHELIDELERLIHRNTRHSA